MSHELRTPLNSVIGFAGLLSRSGNLSDRESMFAERIQSNGRHLLELINDILDLSRIEAGRVQLERGAIAITPMVTEVLDSFRTSQTGLTLTLEAPSTTLEPILADARRLRQVFLNVIGNAVKFTETGGVTVRVVTRGRRVTRVDVIDTGPGIPDDHVQSVFRPFEQAQTGHDRTHEGTGLGLPISRQICRLHSYDLSLTSTGPTGSTFSIHFADDQVGMRAGVVLVADDDRDARLLLEAELDRHGYRSVLADSGEQAVSMARALRPIAITLDLMMPGQSGLDTLAELKSDPKTRDIPVIICSIVGDELKSALGDASAVLNKPLDTKRLAACLDTATASIPRRDGSVLVIDDDADTRLLLSETLEAAGYRVDTSPSGELALQDARVRTPDVVVLDLRMPGMGGVEFLTELRSDEGVPQPAVVVYSAMAPGEEQTGEALALSQGWIQKSDGDPAELLSLVDKLLQQEAPV